MKQVKDSFHGFVLLSNVKAHLSLVLFVTNFLNRRNWKQYPSVLKLDMCLDINSLNIYCVGSKKANTQ